MTQATRIGILVLLAAVVFSIQSPLHAAKPDKGEKLKAKDVMLSRGLPEVTDEQLALTEVDYAPGAPAVVLMQAVEYDWDGVDSRRDRYFRRLKILDEDAIQDYGSFRFDVWGDTVHISSVDARTILPDGTVVNAKDEINREESDDGQHVVHVAFPQVQVGAILDFDIQYTDEWAWSVDPWETQQEIPVLDTRLILKPPLGLRFRVAPIRLPAERSQPDVSVNIAGGGKAFGWAFRDVEPFPDIAYLPPPDDVSPKLFIVLQQYKSSNSFFAIAADWPSWGEWVSEDWEEWYKRDRDAAEALAKQLAPAEGSEVQKAEAIRVGLHERMRVKRVNRYYSEDTPDKLLNSGSTSSGGLAGLTVVMLRAVGVDADVVAIRRRSDGIVPIEFPVPRMMNDLMVRIPDGRGGQMIFSPTSDEHVQHLPFDCSGVLAFPLDGEATGPQPVPDFKATENQTRRTVRATLHPDGRLEGKSTETFSGIGAEVWRDRLRDDSEDERRNRLERALQYDLPGLVLGTMEISGLEADSKRITLKCEWEVEGFAAVAGNRLIFNPNLFDRIETADWASETREFDIDLDMNHELVDTYMFRLPDNVKEVTLPDAVSLVADPAVGAHDASYTFRGKTLVAKRQHRIDVYRIPAQYYGQVRGWFAAIAENDEKPVVVELQ